MSESAVLGHAPSPKSRAVQCKRPHLCDVSAISTANKVQLEVVNAEIGFVGSSQRVCVVRERKAAGGAGLLHCSPAATLSVVFQQTISICSTGIALAPPLLTTLFFT